MVVQVELVDDPLMEQTDDVRAGAEDEAAVGERAFELAGPADALASLEDQHTAPGTGEICGGGEAVVAGTHDHHVPVATRRLGHRQAAVLAAACPVAAHRACTCSRTLATSSPDSRARWAA